MANEATAELYRRQSGLNKAKFTTDYEQYLADLASKYGISNDQLNANLESRGILRSGEAGTARTRLGAAEEAARTTARTNYDYNVGNEDINLAQRLAGLMTGGTGGTPAPATPASGTPPSETTATVPMYRTPDDPAYDGMRDRGPRTPDLSGVDFAGLGQMMEANKKPKPVDLSGVNWNALAGFGGGSSTAKTGTTRVNPVSAKLR
jgi:hypothetical protein